MLPCILQKQCPKQFLEIKLIYDFSKCDNLTETLLLLLVACHDNRMVNQNKEKGSKAIFDSKIVSHIYVKA